MYPKLSQAERADLILRYQRLPEDQAVTMLPSPQKMSIDVHHAVSFAYDEIVQFIRHNSYRPDQGISMIGSIGLFFRPVEQAESQPIWALMVTPTGNMFRVEITSLSKIDPGASQESVNKT